MLFTFRTIAKYERKILMRSWFFRIFSVLSLFVLFAFNMGEISPVGDMEWAYRAVPSNMPYASLMLLNLAQAIIAVFLSSEFIKRDRKQDTAEVFYVRSMSNATYLFGKAWSILSLFLLINGAAMLLALIFNLIAYDTSVDWQAYIYYPLLISLPTLIFIIGLSSFLMGLIRNQALTFVILLGYILSSLIYLRGSYNYLFDYIAFYLPLFHSQIIGFADWQTIITQRVMYTSLGLSFIFWSILMLNRLPQSRVMNAVSMVLAPGLLGLALFLGYQHLERYQESLELPKQMIALNNEYLEHPRIDIDRHVIELEQKEYRFAATSQISGRVETEAREFVFTLNPALEVKSVISEGRELTFDRKQQLLLIQWDHLLAADTTVEFAVNYEGTIDENACYLDIDPELKYQKPEQLIFDLGSRYAFLEPDFLLLTPENQWYPQAGVGYSDKSPFWYRKDLIQYQLTVKTLPGLHPVSQTDARKIAEDTYVFEPDFALPQLSLSIGNYRKSSFETDSLTFSAYYLEGHDYFTDAFPDIRDTLPVIVRERLGDFERRTGLKYPYREFTLVEVPGQFKSYDRTWTSIHQTNQAAMVYIPEKGMYTRNFDFNGSVARQSRWRQNRNVAPEELQMRVLRTFLEEFFRFKNVDTQSRGGNTEVQESINPYYQFVQFYEMCNNLDAREWPVMNRIFESYLRVDQGNSPDWVRRSSGSTQDELANLVLQEKSFSEILTLTENRPLIDNVIELKGDMLFSMIQAQAGTDRFREYIIRLLEKYRFQNFPFEDFTARIQSEFGVDIAEHMDKWFNETEMPRFLITTPIAETVQSGNREMTRVLFKASNLGEAAGVIRSTFLPEGNVDKLLYLEPGQTKEVAYLSVTEPHAINFNTLASGNLPSQLEYSFEQINETNATNAREKEQPLDEPLGWANEGEIIVDNEDPNFEFSQYEEVSRLRKWLRPAGDDGFKYKGTQVWRPPLNWTATTDDRFFGEFIRSALYIKAGEGSKEAKWKIPVPEAGRYNVLYHVFKDDSFNWDNNQRGIYQFTIPHQNGVDRPTLELTGNTTDGWASIGDYAFAADTITITLSNESRLRAIFADAIKLVKMD
jgi:hypothetical protein